MMWFRPHPDDEQPTPAQERQLAVAAEVAKALVSQAPTLDLEALAEGLRRG